MPGLRVAPQMRTRSASKPREWFRIENAFVDEEHDSTEVTPVYIYDEIGDSWWGDSTTATDFVRLISGIKTPQIDLHLNSPGGDIFDGVAIYNALKAHPARVRVIVDSLAASAASFIAQAGNEIIMTKAATMMIHDGSGLAWGDAATLRDTADLLDKLSNTIAEIYSDRAGQTKEFWRNLMIEEVWYNSHEAVEAGLADRIGEETKKEDEEAAQNRWDLSIFNHAGRNAAPNPFQIRQRIANKLKENIVSQSSTEGQPNESEVNPASPDVNPDAETTEGDAQEVQEGRDTNPGAVPDPPTGAENKAPQGPVATRNEGTGKITFVVNGAPTEDHQVVQQRLNMLEQFRNETVKQSKIDFVQQLAAENKIFANQIDKLTAYALNLTDDGYEAWSATYEGVPGLPMLGGSHAGGTTNHDGPQSQEREQSADHLEILRDTVKQHKLAKMPVDKIKQLPSYQELVALDPTYKL